MGLRRSSIILALSLAGTLTAREAHAENDQSPFAHYVSLPGSDVAPSRGQSAGSGAIGSGDRTRGLLLTRPRARLACLPASLKDAVADIAARFGPVSVESTHRDGGHNRRAGGARQSLHLSCRAVDLRARGRRRGLMAYLRSRPDIGGIKLYGSGIIHIDNGPRRTW